MVVTDLGMPGGGIDLVRFLRSLSAPAGGRGGDRPGRPGHLPGLARAGSRCIVSKYGVDLDLGRCVVRCHVGDVVLVGPGPAAVLDHLLELAARHR